MKTFKAALKYTNRTLLMSLVLVFTIIIFASSFLQAKFRQKSIESVVEQFLTDEVTAIDRQGGSLLIQPILTKFADSENENKVTSVQIVITNESGKPIAASDFKRKRFSTKVGNRSFDLRLPTGEAMKVSVVTYWNVFNIELLCLLLFELFLSLCLFILTKRSLTRLLQSFQADLQIVSSKLAEGEARFHQRKIEEPRNEFQLVEFGEIDQDLSTLYETISSLKNKTEQAAFLEGLKITSEQVSHDVESPLSALDMLYYMLDEVSEEKRSSLQESTYRIREIVNSLKNGDLIKKEAGIASSASEKSETEVVFIAPVIDSIISEKKIQYHKNKSVKITFAEGKSNYGLFARINIHQFQRAVSNIINNAVEALGDREGLIQVVLTSAEDGKITIEIQDNGKGIPETVLKSIGERGFSFDKQGGSGLGLNHAINTLKSWDGDLKIKSSVGMGTSICMTLPKVEPPSWFVPDIKICDINKVVILDDDQMIHDKWEKRIFRSNESDKSALTHLYSTDELKDFYGRNFSDVDSTLFLIDHDLIGSTENGLNLILLLEIQAQSILVTNRYNDARIRNLCHSKGVRLIPKVMVDFVPVGMA